MRALIRATVERACAAIDRTLAYLDEKKIVLPLRTPAHADTTDPPHKAA
jgi:hypothetical protein